MLHVVTNLKDIDAHIHTSNIEDEHKRTWLSKRLEAEVVRRLDWLTNISDSKKIIAETTDDEHVKRAVENGEDIYMFVSTEKYEEEYRSVVDWLAELEQRDPRLFAKLDRITWKQAVEHSTRWHEKLVKQSEKSNKEAIPFDGDCPIVLEHDDGLKWVWLKTDKARDDEGRIMGHCVGSGGYDHLKKEDGVFSLRDSSGRPYVTVQLKALTVVQAKMKGNAEVSEKYKAHVEILKTRIGSRLIYYGNPLDELKNGIVTMKNRHMTIYFTNGILGRHDEPAIEYYDGTKEWWLDGKPHRIGNPAIVAINGDKKWYHNGCLHREDGPAIHKIDGTREWWVNGERHRKDGPAAIFPNGDLEWWINGKLHREDGPARIWMNEQQEWWIDGKFHREDGPAIERSNGFQEWWVRGLRHREGGPAVIKADESREYWIDGKKHREDGPAVEWANGTEEWWKNGEKMTKNEPRSL